MCFSISMAKTAEEIAAAFGVFSGDIPPLPEYFHVSGFTYPDVPVLYNSEGEDKITLMKWGLIPSWIKTEKDKENIRSKTLNARLETADTLPSFRGSFRKGRCIVIADGFYEPHHREGKSYPYYIRRRDSGIISLGGLYAKSSVDGNEILSFSIITLPASPAMAEIHNKKKRMPFVMPSDKHFIDKWLDPDIQPADVKNMFADKRVSDFLNPYDTAYEAYTVSKDIYSRGPVPGKSILEEYIYPELSEGLLPF